MMDILVGPNMVDCDEGRQVAMMWRIDVMLAHVLGEYREMVINISLNGRHGVRWITLSLTDLFDYLSDGQN